jgi:release factor glutamine methyltransferase
MGKITRFLNCKIDLSKKVFEPRIETEFWVGKAIKEINQKIENRKQKIEVLDIFAGSGCIGIDVLKNIKNARVDFADISQKAIKQIRINLKLNRASRNQYRIYKSNLFEKIRNNKYDIIFANPPYVALDRISQVQKEVLQKEPPAALFAGKDGMFWIERFSRQVKKYLDKKGVIYMEFDPFQKEKIKKILEKQGFKFQFRKDRFKKYRWLKASP